MYIALAKYCKLYAVVWDTMFRKYGKLAQHILIEKLYIRYI